jgi:hypothetical protein
MVWRHGSGTGKRVVRADQELMAVLNDQGARKSCTRELFLRIGQAPKRGIDGAACDGGERRLEVEVRQGDDVQIELPAHVSDGESATVAMHRPFEHRVMSAAAEACDGCPTSGGSLAMAYTACPRSPIRHNDPYPFVCGVERACLITSRPSLRSGIHAVNQ